MQVATISVLGTLFSMANDVHGDLHVLPQLHGESGGHLMCTFNRLFRLF